MVSPVINEQFYDAAFLVSEGNGYLSKEAGYIDNTTGSDFLYSGGLILNQVAAGSASSAAKTGGNTGNGTVGSLSTGANSKFGVYVLTAKTATDFGVVDPSGDVLPDATVGTAYVGPVDFTLAAAGTAFVAGDAFNVTVAEQSGGWVSWTGGSINRLGILWGRKRVAAGGFEKITVVVRECEVNGAELQWDPAVLAAGNAATLQANALAALAAANVIAR